MRSDTRAALHRSASLAGDLTEMTNRRRVLQEREVSHRPLNCTRVQLATLPVIEGGELPSGGKKCRQRGDNWLAGQHTMPAWAHNGQTNRHAVQFEDIQWCSDLRRDQLQWPNCSSDRRDFPKLTRVFRAATLAAAIGEL
jgi:hypothetical protein